MTRRARDRQGLWNRCSRAVDDHPVAVAVFFALVLVFSVSWALLDTQIENHMVFRLWFAAALALGGLVWALRRALRRDAPNDR